jgi:hypothetical protein
MGLVGHGLPADLPHSEPSPTLRRTMISRLDKEHA